MDIQVVPFDPRTASPEEWRRFHVYRRAHQMETDPEDPVFDDETIERMERHSNVQWDWRRLVVLDRDRPDVTMGEVTLEFSRPGTPTHEQNAHIAHAWIGLLKPYRRQAVGSRLLPKVVELAREQGRTILQSWAEEPDGKAFAAAIGAKTVQRRRHNRLRFDAVDWAMVERWAAEGPQRNPHTTLRWFKDRIDDDVLEKYCALYTEVFNMQPFEDADRGEFIFSRVDMEE